MTQSPMLATARGLSGDELLARILSRQPDCAIPFQDRPLLPWVMNPAGPGIRQRAEWRATASEDGLFACFGSGIYSCDTIGRSMHSSGSGHWQQSSAEDFGYGGGGSYSDTVTQNTGNQSEGTSFSQTTSESLSEGGGHSASSATSMDWVRDDDGWRLSAYSGSDGGESHAGYGYAFDQTTQSASWAYGESSSSSGEVSDSIGESYAYGYSRQFSGSDVGYGNMTITGTGSGSGWAGGYSNHSSEGTTCESNWTSSSGYSYSGWSSGWDDATDTNGYGYQEGWGETYSYGCGGGSQWGGGTASGSNTDDSGSSWGWTQYSGGAWTSGSGSDSTSSSGSYSESISSPGFYGGGLNWSPFATGGQGLGYGMSAPDPGTSMTSGEAPGDVPADGATGPTGSSGDAGGDGEEDVDRGQSPEEWADNNSDPDHPGEHSWFFKIAEWGDGQYKAFYDVPDRETLQDHAATDEQGDAELAMRTQLASIFMQMPILCDGAVVEKDGRAIGVLRYGKLYEFKSVTAQQDKFPNADYIEAVAGQWGQVADALAPFAAGRRLPPILRRT